MPPYDGPDAAARLTEFTTSIRLVGVPLEQPDDEPVPQIDGIEHYVERRVEDQIRYYTLTAAQHARALTRARRVLVVVGLLGGLMGLVGVMVGKAAALVPMFASISAALAALIQSRRYAEQVALYQDTALELDLRLAQWVDAGDSRHEAIVAFVTACEAAMERENSSWRAGWLDGDKKKERFEAIAKARDMAEKLVHLPRAPVESGAGVPQTS
ncbi:MAG: SLATT domain-containing protein [Myxococcota bacterium]